MEKEYVKELDRTYLVLGDGQIDDDEYNFQMVLRGRLPGVLPLSIALKDGKKSLRADVTACTNIASRYKNLGLTGHDLRKILSAIRDAALKMPKLLMSAQDLCLDPECIFLGPGADEVLLCYVPHLSDSEPDSIRTLAEFFLKKIDHADQPAADLAYELFDQVSSGSYILGDVLQKLLRGQNHLHSSDKDSPGQGPNRSTSQDSTSHPSSGADYASVREDGMYASGRGTFYDQGSGPAGYRQDASDHHSSSARPASSQGHGARVYGAHPQDSVFDEFPNKNAQRVTPSSRKASVKGRSSHTSHSSSHASKAARSSKSPRDQSRKRRKKKLLRYLLPVIVILPAACIAIVYFRMDLTQIAGMGFLCSALIWMIHNSMEKHENERRNIWFDEDEAAESDDRFYQSLRQELYARSESPGLSRNSPAYAAAGSPSRMYTDPASGSPEYPASSFQSQAYTASASGSPEYQASSFQSQAYAASASGSQIYNATVSGSQGYTASASGRGHIKQGAADSDSPDETNSRTRMLRREYPVLVSLQKDRCPDITLNREHMILGKSRTKSDVILPDSAVSRKHARIERRMDGYYVTDLFSTNGTFLDGHRLESGQAVRLNDGTQLTVASLHYHVTIPAVPG